MSAAPAPRTFGQAVAGEDAAVDVARAALLIAREEYPDLDPEVWISRLDALGASFRACLPVDTSADEAAHALSRFLAAEEGFRGNTESYEDPRNSFLNDVLTRRTGIPITLALVYQEVGTRAGLRVEGIPLPGHFLAAVVGEDGHSVIIDPFHGGATLSAADLQRRLDRMFDSRLRLDASMLAYARRRDIVARLLRNLKAIYATAEDGPRLGRILDLLVVVEPELAEHLRDRGLFHARSECFSLAVRDLEAFLRMAPDTDEADELGKWLARMRHRASRLD